MLTSLSFENMLVQLGKHKNKINRWQKQFINSNQNKFIIEIHLKIENQDFVFNFSKIVENTEA